MDFLEEGEGRAAAHRYYLLVARGKGWEENLLLLLKDLIMFGKRRTFHLPAKKVSRQEGGVQVPEVRVGSGGLPGGRVMLGKC